MKKAATFVAILYGLFLLAGCSSTPPAAPTTDTISFKIIAQGQHSGIGFEQFFEIRHPDDWQTLWQRHSTSEPLPLINFQETNKIVKTHFTIFNCCFLRPETNQRLCHSN